MASLVYGLGTRKPLVSADFRVFTFSDSPARKYKRIEQRIELTQKLSMNDESRPEKWSGPA